MPAFLISDLLKQVRIRANLHLESALTPGIFSRLKEMGLTQPEDVFSIQFFRNDPKPFYNLAKVWFWTGGAFRLSASGIDAREI